jgi:hypothetical protein
MFSPAGPGFKKALLKSFHSHYLSALVPGMLMFSPARPPPIPTKPGGNCFKNAKYFKTLTFAMRYCIVAPVFLVLGDPP